MKLSLNWIKDYVKIPDDLELSRIAYDLTMSMAEVEGVTELARKFDNMVVGVVKEILPHPNADKLVITRVDVGAAEPVQIVTGATNLTEGDYIPVALAGANLAGGLKIKKGKIRGEVSDGMLCSIEELGASRAEYPEAPEDGIYVFTEPQPLGADARPILELLDDVIEFETTANV